MATVDTSATCRTVVVDVGQPGEPQYVLTQAQSFLVETSGRAVPEPPIRATPGAARRRRRRRPSSATSVPLVRPALDAGRSAHPVGPGGIPCRT